MNGSSSAGEDQTSVPFEDFLALLRATEVGPQADLSLLDQVIALWEQGRIVLTSEQAGEMLALNASQLETLLDEGRLPGAYRDAQGHWQLPLDKVIAQHERPSSTPAQSKST